MDIDSIFQALVVRVKMYLSGMRRLTSDLIPMEIGYEFLACRYKIINQNQTTSVELKA